MNDCLFCKIVRGEIPSTRVYEDESIIAFLDLHPVNKGHTLVVPKAHAENFLTIPKAELCAMMPIVQRLAKAVMQATGAEGFNLHVNNGRVSGQEIDHLHVHIIPRLEADGLKHWPKVTYAQGEMATVSENIIKQLR